MHLHCFIAGHPLIGLRCRNWNFWPAKKFFELCALLLANSTPTGPILGFEIGFPLLLEYFSIQCPDCCRRPPNAVQPNWHQMPSLMTNRLRFGLIRASTKGDWVRSLNWRRWSKLNKLLNFRSCSDWISNCFHQVCQKFNKIWHKVFYKLRDGYCTAVTAMFYIYVVTCDSLNWNLINSNHDSQQVTILACKMFSLIKSLVEQLFGVSSPVLKYCLFTSTVLSEEQNCSDGCWIFC